MKQLIYSLFLFTLFCSSGAFAQDEDQWEYHLSSDLLKYEATYGDSIWFGSQGGIIKVNTNTLEASWLTKLNSGLSNQHVRSFAEDQDNVKWFTTFNKVSALDGDEWTIYDTGNSSLPHNYGIRSVYIGPDNKKYFQVLSTLVVYDGTNWNTYDEDNSPIENSGFGIRAFAPNGTIYCTIGEDLYSFYNGTFTLLSEINDVLGSTSIFSVSVVCDQNNVAYISSGAGLIRLDGDVFEVFNTTNSILPDNYTTHMVVDEENQLWFKSSDQVMRFDGADFEQISTLGSSNGILSIFPIGNDQAYLYDNSTGIIHYDNGDTTAIPFGLYSPYYLDIVHIDQEGGLWVDLANVGLAYYNGIEWQMVDIPGANFPSNFVYSLALDNDGNPWFGFIDGGIRTLQNGEWIRYYNDDFGSSFAQTIVSILQWGNKMVFALNSELVFLENDEFTVLDCNVEPMLCGSFLRAMAIDNDDNLWLVNSSGDSELIKYDGSNWESYDAFPGISASILTQSIYISSEDEIYVGSNGDGFSKFSNGTFEVYNTDNSPLPENSVRCFLKTQNGVLWLGTAGGLVKKDGEEWTVYDLENIGESSSINNINDMAIDANGTLWLAVWDRGLISYDGVDEWNIWTGDNSDIIDELLFHVEVAPNGYKWIAGNWNAASFLEAGYSVSVLDNFDENAGISLYPNPSHGMFKIKTNPGDEIHRIDLIDVQGKVLKTWSSSESTYDISNVGNGIYILKVNLNGEYMTARILKQ